MANIQEELQLSKKLLRVEWKEDLEQFKRKTWGKSIVERKESGSCWYPVQVVKVKTGLADKLLVEVKNSSLPLSGGFQSGKSVSLFSNSSENDPQKTSLSGVINYVRGDRMMITLGVESPPEWFNEGKLGIDLLFDENTYRQMETSLDAVIRAESGRLAELKRVLLGDSRAGFGETGVEISLDGLNDGQCKAVDLVLRAKDVAIIHGPPGTGKTTTLVAAIRETLKKSDQVLACAPSNAAVDLLVEKLMRQGVQTLRIGHPARIDDDILGQTLDSKISAHPSYKDLRKLKKSLAELKRQAKKFRRSFGSREHSQRQQQYDEARRVQQEISMLEDYIRFDVYQQTEVFACTLAGAASPALKGMRFPVVFIDEAAQGLEPATWIPLLAADKVVMAGDHCQLPPTVKSIEAAGLGLSETLFEKVIARQPKAAKMLGIQYRMPSLIMGFSSRYFYRNELIAAPNTYSHRLTAEEQVLTFIDTAGSGYGEFTDRETLSIQNVEEAKFTLDHLVATIKRIGRRHFVENAWEIGLISPYRAQVELLKKLIKEEDSYAILQELEDLLTVDTIDGFQGQERDLILISLVRSNAEGEIGFLADIRRMNVALTRAKRKLIVVGDSATLASHPFYQRFLDYIEENGCYTSIYEWMD